MSLRNEDASGTGKALWWGGERFGDALICG